MFASKSAALALAMALMSTPAMATSFVADTIDNPSSRWAGIDYWGVQVSQFSAVSQLLTFTIADDSKVDLYIQGSPKFQFTDVLLNGQSIGSNFTVGGTTALKASGYAAAGTVELLFKADYTCKDCWGDWFGGYVQVTKAALPKPTPPAAAIPPVPEPGTWAMMLTGFGMLGVAMRRRRPRVKVSYA